MKKQFIVLFTVLSILNSGVYAAPQTSNPKRPPQVVGVVVPAVVVVPQTPKKQPPRRLIGGLSIGHAALATGAVVVVAAILITDFNHNDNSVNVATTGTN